MTREEIDTLWFQAMHESIRANEEFTRYRFAELVAAAEREACAKVCEDKIKAEYETGKVDHNEMAWTQACAMAIRTKGKE